MLESGPLDAPPQLTAGWASLPRPFGAFELLEEVARGGMGIVYKARQTQAGRLVAVKVLLAGHFAAPDFVQRFRTEAEAVAALDHPHIVPVYDVGECEGQPFFSMKFVEGGSLAGRIARSGGRIAEREAVTWLCKLARAVHYAHQRGVLHRDIKPGNVLLDGAGEPFLTDFGLAKLAEKDSHLTRTTAMLGTPGYMSPEQARGEARELTTAVDVYGLGAVFYELLTGQPPFAGSTAMETVRQVLEREPRRPSLLRPAVDRDLETIGLKCLEKDSARRYGSAEALAEDLERWLRHEPVLARPAPLAERIAKWVRRHRAAFAALVSIALVLMAGLTVSVWLTLRATDAEALAYRRLAESQASEARAVKAAAAETDARQGAQAVTTFLTNTLLASASRRDGKMLTVAEILDDTAAEIDTIGYLPEEQKSLLVALGQSYLALGLFREATPLLTRYRDFCLSTLGPDNRQTCRGDFFLATALAGSGRVAEAQELRENLLLRNRRASGAETDATQQTMEVLAATWAANGSPDKAIRMLEELLPLRTRMSGPENNLTYAVKESLADAYLAAGRYHEAAAQWEALAGHVMKTPDASSARKVHVLTQLALASLRDGRLPEALRHWAAASVANKDDRIRDIWFAGLQVWFGNEAEHAAMSVRLLKDEAATGNAGAANCVAKLVSLRPVADPEVRAAASALARRAVALGQQDTLLPWYYLSLGMAEYRAARSPEALAALLAADEGAARTEPGQRTYIQSTAGIYRAMILARRGDLPAAREAFVRATAEMKPLPADGQDPLSDHANQDDLVLWLAYKEAQAMLAGPPEK